MSAVYAVVLRYRFGFLPSNQNEVLIPAINVAPGIGNP